jgi:hypothetical protein
VSDLARRLVAHIVLRDADAEQRLRTNHPSEGGFWTDDFPRMSPASLMPEGDQLLERFLHHADKIDDAMASFCNS